MAGEARIPSSLLKARLLKEGSSHSFAQALRLLRRVVTAEGADPDRKSFWKRVKVRPHLSMAFAPSDIQSIRASADEPPAYEMTVEFLGLYGASSPLPNFYTEDLLDEQGSGKSATRDFLDLFNSALYPLHFASWSKHRLFHSLVEAQDPAALERLFCLLGLPEPGACRQVAPQALLKYIGLFALATRPMEGLRGLLSDYFGTPFGLDPCVARTVRIPGDQRFRLGAANHQLGETACLGSEVQDSMGKFRVRIGPLDSEAFRRFWPGRPAYLQLAELIRLYCRDSLCWDLRLSLHRTEGRCTCLGHPEWAVLGLGTWLLTTQDALGRWTVDFHEPEANAQGEAAWSA